MADRTPSYRPPGFAPQDADSGSDQRIDLILACEEGNFKKVMKLLQDGNDIQAKDSQGNTALHKCKTVEVATLLVDRGADIHERNGKGSTPLHYAVDANRPPIVKLLLDRDADVEARTEDGRTAMFWAHSKEIANELMNKGAEINARDNSQTTPLHYAAFWGAPDVVQTLAQRGADVNASNASGNTPLHWAATAQVAKALLQHGAQANSKDMHGKASLHYAATSGNSEVALALLEAKADIHCVDAQSGDSPLHLAAESGRTAAADILLAHGASSNTKNHLGESPLHKAVRRRKSGVTSALLAHNADPNIRSLEGFTAMDLAKDAKLQGLLTKAGGVVAEDIASAPAVQTEAVVPPMKMSAAQAAVRDLEQARAQMTSTEEQGSAQRLQQMHMRTAPGMEDQKAPGCSCAIL